MPERSLSSVRNIGADDGALEGEPLTRGLHLRELAQQFRDRNPILWHLSREWLSLEDGIRASLLPSALKRAMCMASIGQGSRLENLDFEQFTLQIAPESGPPRTVPAFSIAVIYQHRSGSTGELKWTMPLTSLQQCPAHAQSFYYDLMTTLEKYRVDGLELRDRAVPFPTDSFPGEEYVGLVSEILEKSFTAIPTSIIVEGSLNVFWALVPTESFGLSPEFDAKSALTAVHTHLWSKFEGYRAVLGHDWPDAIRSLAHSLNVPLRTFIDACGEPVVSLLAPGANDPQGMPLELFIYREYRGVDVRGQAIYSPLQSSWRHHLPSDCPALRAQELPATPRTLPSLEDDELQPLRSPSPSEPAFQE